MVEVVVGRIGRAHGVRGEVSVDVRTDEPARRFGVGTSLRVAPSLRYATLTVAAVRPHAGRLLVTFEQVPDRTAAEQLSGATLAVDVDADERPEDPEEFYDHQLVGLAVHDATGSAVGTVESVLHLPAQELLSVRRGDGREALVPFVTALVPVVDVAEGRIVVSDRAGLLDPDEAGPTTRASG